MSGRDTFRTGMQFDEIQNSQPWGLPLNEVTLAERFKAVGYSTHMVRKSTSPYSYSSMSTLMAASAGDTISKGSSAEVNIVVTWGSLIPISIPGVMFFQKKLSFVCVGGRGGSSRRRIHVTLYSLKSWFMPLLVQSFSSIHKYSYLVSVVNTLISAYVQCNPRHQLSACTSISYLKRSVLFLLVRIAVSAKSKSILMDHLSRIV